MKRASILGCSACASADDALLLVWSASPNVIPTPRPDALIGPSVFVINTRQRGSALHLSEHAPAPALCSSHSPWNKSRGRRTRARNGMLKTDGSTRFLHLPHLSTSASQPSLVIPGSRWCGQHTLFGLGCVQDRIRATKTAFGVPPLPRLFAHPRFPVSSWQNLGDYATSTSLLAHARLPTDCFPWSSLD